MRRKSTEYGGARHIAIVACALLLSLIAAVVSRRYGGAYMDDWHYPPEVGAYEMLEFHEGDVLVQPFVSSAAFLKRVSIYLIHAPETETGTLHVVLSSEDGKTLKELSRPLNEIAASEWEAFFLEAKTVPEATYFLTFSMTDVSAAEPIYFLLSDVSPTVAAARAPLYNGAETYGYVYLDFLCTTPRALHALMIAAPLFTIAAFLLIYETCALVMFFTGERQSQ